MRGCLAVPLFLAVVTSALVDGAGAHGFCLDLVPRQLEGTGFTASPSRYATEPECLAAGHEWCPLSNETDTWQAGGQSVEYYWFSACCQGRQGRGLIPEPRTGVPTCRTGVPHEECTRTHWQQKVINDLFSDYDPRFAPTTVSLPALRAPGQRSAGVGGQGPSCVCAADDPRCENRTADGSKCLVCRTSDRCSVDAVSLGLHFFKLHTVDLKTSLLAFSAWVRQSWSDPRLKYNAQCYAGLDYFEVLAQSGTLGNTMIWTPDLELYNGEESIFKGLGSHLALVYPCTGSGGPSRGSCGSVFWSRPGLLKALCMYEGLLRFPLDTLRCKLEIAGFMLDGRHQDVVLRASDGGVSWTGQGVKDGFVGLTSGSTFQDYRITNISSTRYVVFYDCCPDNPYPTLVWQIEFNRSRDYYMLRLIIPGVLLACMSFVTFWMDPEIGERLGFCITVILAMFTNDVVAASLMPVANEKSLMDYLSLGCTLFGVLSLVETAFVLFLYHHIAEGWMDLLVPEQVQRCLSSVSGALQEWRRRWSGEQPDPHRAAETEDVTEALADVRSQGLARPSGSLLPRMMLKHGPEALPKDAKVRRQLYRQIFYTVDKDFSGSLDLDEVSEFARFMFGDQFDEAKAREFIETFDLNHNGLLGFREFAIFCDGFLPHVDDLEFMQAMLDGFLQIVERKRLMCQRMWQQRAKGIDRFCRWTVPPGFLLFIAVLFSKSNAGFEELVGNGGGQFGLIFVGYVLLLMALLAFIAYSLYKVWRRQALPRQRIGNSVSGYIGAPPKSFNTNLDDSASDDSVKCAASTSEEPVMIPPGAVAVPA